MRHITLCFLIFCISACGIASKPYADRLNGSWVSNSSTMVYHFRLDGTLIAGDCNIGSWNANDNIILINFPQNSDLEDIWTIRQLNEDVLLVVTSDYQEIQMNKSSNANPDLPDCSQNG